ncbi:MAG: hypothetical protein NVSMB58_36860 [Terriglobales bacterium]
MDLDMTMFTKSYKVLFAVIPPVAAEFLVMDLKLFHAATTLASPVVALGTRWQSSRYAALSKANSGVLVRLDLECSWAFQAIPEDVIVLAAQLGT